MRSGKGNRVKFVPSVASNTSPARPTIQQTGAGEAPPVTTSLALAEPESRCGRHPA